MTDWSDCLLSRREGTVRNGVGDSIKMELLSIIRGEYYDIDLLQAGRRVTGQGSKQRVPNPTLGRLYLITYQRDGESRKCTIPRNDITCETVRNPMWGHTSSSMKPSRECRAMERSPKASISAFTFFTLPRVTSVKSCASVLRLTFDKLPRRIQSFIEKDLSGHGRYYSRHDRGSRPIS